MQYAANFQMKNNIFPQNIDRRYTLSHGHVILMIIVWVYGL